MNPHPSWIVPALLGWPLAHLMLTGLGPWGDGIAQLVLQPTPLLLVVGLVLLAARAVGPVAIGCRCCCLGPGCWGGWSAWAWGPNCCRPWPVPPWSRRLAC